MPKNGALWDSTRRDFIYNNFEMISVVLQKICNIKRKLLTFVLIVLIFVFQDWCAEKLRIKRCPMCSPHNSLFKAEKCFVYRAQVNCAVCFYCLLKGYICDLRRSTVTYGWFLLFDLFVFCFPLFHSVTVVIVACEENL